MTVCRDSQKLELELGEVDVVEGGVLGHHCACDVERARGEEHK